MNTKPTVIEALNAAVQRRDEINTIIRETNQYTDLSSAYYSFGEALEEAKQHFNDEEILSLLIPLEEDSGETRPTSDNDVLDSLISEAIDLKETAQRIGVAVKFSELIGVDYEDVGYVSSWSSSSLYC